MALWIPDKRWFPRTPSEHLSLSLEEIAHHIGDDILLADSFFLPNSHKLKPLQRVTLRGFAQHKFNWIQACRGASKSYMLARFILLWGLTHRVSEIITSPTFRQSLLVFQYIMTLIRENSLASNSVSLEHELDGVPTTGGMEARIRIKNGTVIKALPMADGSRLRGERADLLAVDEAFKQEREMFESHILPFLLRPVVEGSDQVDPKLIMATSAEYEDCFAYHFLTNTILPRMVDEEKLADADPGYRRKYLVLDWNVEDLESSGFKLEPDVIELMLGSASAEEKQRALYNKWVGVSGQFFPGNLVDRLASPVVHIEHTGDSDARYCLSVDVATARDGDNFVIQVLKFIGNRRMALVNSFWSIGQSADEMAWYIHQFNQRFNPEWVIIDKGGGGLFVVSSLSKRKLVFSDGTEKVVERPLIPHDEFMMLGERKVIMNKASDSIIREAFQGERARGGEEIKTEDVLVHLVYSTLKECVVPQEPLLVIPMSASEEGDDFDRSEVKILDNIRESVYQLRHLALKMEEDSEGNKTVVRSKSTRTPMYTWKTSHKDGATALSYAIIPYLLHYASERGQEAGGYEPIVERNLYDQQYLYQYHDDPSQFLNPFRT